MADMTHPKKEHIRFIESDGIFSRMLRHFFRPRVYLDPKPIDEAMQFRPLPLGDKEEP